MTTMEYYDEGAAAYDRFMERLAAAVGQPAGTLRMSVKMLGSS